MNSINSFTTSPVLNFRNRNPTTQFQIPNVCRTSFVYSSNRNCEPEARNRSFFQDNYIQLSTAPPSQSRKFLRVSAAGSYGPPAYRLKFPASRSQRRHGNTIADVLQAFARGGSGLPDPLGRTFDAKFYAGQRLRPASLSAEKHFTFNLSLFTSALPRVSASGKRSG